ncbi:MAG: type II toxin-antitoxin system VapC family toxin [Spirochaetales bacterium]|nr:type II toxin-antitoxin system VapC family toxin [Spirochaetales bacterium]
MKKVSLDTNAYSALIAGNVTVLDALGEANEVYLSIFVIGELYYGFTNGSKEKKNREILNNFLKKPTVKIIHTTMETAEIYGRLKTNLKKKGNPVPINDLWIASHAIETGSFLLTFDTHFKTIPEVLLY